MTKSNVKILTHKIDQVLRTIHPKKIAVAFLGTDYKDFVETCNIESIIISPTEGSNPYAIQALAKEIGWEKIFFLNKLHAKMYIGKKGTLIGSANLSYNGLSDNSNALQEICVKVPTTDEINNIYEKILTAAKEEFQDKVQKKKALDKLEKIWRIRVAARLEKTKKHRAPDFENFELLANNQFYLDWYYGTTNNPNLKDKKKYNPQKFSDWMYLSLKEKIKANDWILCWEMNKRTGKMQDKRKLSWVYAHEILKGESKETGYPNLAIQWEDAPKPKAPFNVNSPNFKSAFKTVINRDEYAAFRADDKNGKDPFIASSNKLQRLLPHLLKDIKEEIQKSK